MILRYEHLQAPAYPWVVLYYASATLLSHEVFKLNKGEPLILTSSETKYRYMI